ncbi:MAG: hypothetical protein ACI31M_01270 [Bacilli bacterium]
MTFKEFYISDKNGKSNCVIRSLCKILNKEYDDIYNALCKAAEELNYSSFNDIEVFETYMENNNIFKINCEEDIKVKELKIDNFSYIVFCYDKKNFYHMISIVDNVIYDKNSDCMDLYVISVYEKK